jgi:hypothetical protein
MRDCDGILHLVRAATRLAPRPSQAYAAASVLQPAEPMHPWHAGNSFCTAGQMGKAREAYRRALVIDPLHAKVGRGERISENVV